MNSNQDSGAPGGRGRGKHTDRLSSRSRTPLPGSNQRRRAAARGADNDDPCPTTRFCNMLDECEMAAALSLPDSLSDTCSEFSELGIPETQKPPVDTPKPRDRWPSHAERRARREAAAFALGLAEQQPAAASGEQQPYDPPAARCSDPAYLAWREQLEGGQARRLALAPRKGKHDGKGDDDDDLDRLLAFCYSPVRVENLPDGTRVYHETAHSQAGSVEQQPAAPSMTLLEQSQTR
jgi:hypothetical protein